MSGVVRCVRAWLRARPAQREISGAVSTPPPSPVSFGVSHGGLTFLQRDVFSSPCIPARRNKKRQGGGFEFLLFFKVMLF